MSELITTQVKEAAHRLHLTNLEGSLDGLLERAEASTMGYLEFLRIPDVSVHLFRSNPYTCSDRFRTPRAGTPRSAGVR
jgi:hypothetical protein